MDNFNFDFDTSELQWGNVADNVTSGSEDAPNKNADRRQVECYEISERTEYRRAYGTVQLCNVLGMEQPKEGTSYHIITAGKVDSISFIKYILLHQDIEYMMGSTWNITGEDILQLREWISKGRIKLLDLYCGEIQVNTYKVEWRMLNDLYRDYPVGRLVCFKNHSKVYAGWGNKFPFVFEGSANMNTNPRTEQVVFTVHRGLAEYYKKHFDRIKSFI